MDGSRFLLISEINLLTKMSRIAVRVLGEEEKVGREHLLFAVFLCRSFVGEFRCSVSAGIGVVLNSFVC